MGKKENNENNIIKFNGREQQGKTNNKITEEQLFLALTDMEKCSHILLEAYKINKNTAMQAIESLLPCCKELMPYESHDDLLIFETKIINKIRSWIEWVEITSLEIGRWYIAFVTRIKDENGMDFIKEPCIIRRDGLHMQYVLDVQWDYQKIINIENNDWQLQIRTTEWVFDVEFKDGVYQALKQ